MESSDKIAVLNSTLSSLYTGIYVAKNVSSIPSIKVAIIACSGLATWGMSRWCWIKFVNLPIEQGQLFCPACVIVRGSVTAISTGNIIPSLLWFITSPNRSMILKLLTQPIRFHPSLGLIVGSTMLQAAVGGSSADRQWKNKYFTSKTI